MQILACPLGTSGLWTLNAPFNNLAIPGTPYTLIALRILSDLIAAGADPEGDYYTPNAISSANYISDLSNNVAILSLQDGAGNVIYVPSSYVNNYPDIGGVPYRVLALTINIGAIPDSLDLSVITAKVSSDVQDLLGVVATTNIVSLSPATILTSTDAATVEAARIANVSTLQTDYSRYLAASTQLATAQSQIAALQNYILTNRTKLGI